MHKQTLLGRGAQFVWDTGFRAGLWLSCFPGRVRDDMEL